MIRTLALLTVAVAAIVVVAWYLSTGIEPTFEPKIQFRDVNESHQITIDNFADLNFSTSDGMTRSLGDVTDSEFTVLVITRGWNSNLCLYCIAQTAQWAGRQKELASLDAELLLVFPVATDADIDKLQQLHQRVKEDGAEIDFPTLLDVKLETVDQLGIRAQLSKPATYIVDRDGKVRFAYVGQSIADRPSVESVLLQLQHLNEK